MRRSFVQRQSRSKRPMVSTATLRLRPQPRRSRTALSVSETHSVRIVGRGLVVVVTFLGLVATTIGAVFAAVYWIEPDLRPRERLGATIDRIAIEHGVTLYEYVQLMGPGSVDGLDDRVEGDLVLVRVTLEGLKNRRYRVATKVMDESGQEVMNPTVGKTSFADTLSTCEVLSPESYDYGITWRCWSRTPPPGTVYRIRAEVYDAGSASDRDNMNATFYGPLLDFSESDLMKSRN